MPSEAVAIAPEAITAALTLLPLPDPATLSDYQRRGITCVWDGIGLSAEEAVDLGPRELPGGGQWFPRGCRSRVGEAAYRLLHEHAPMCEQCVDEPTGCALGRELIRLTREGRR
ncbi:hypothetical protein [Streptomyces sp. NPDC046985]|uniref:hypothetical protein n=1 Tax=Streptomyces sp. NPDC046985 TaxID=3155377 RepID=UPI0033FEB41E